jgi:hypothetical protein
MEPVGNGLRFRHGGLRRTEREKEHIPAKIR